MAAKIQKNMEYPIEIKGKTIKQVRKINLSGRNLKFIPDNVFQYTNLEKLDLSNNRIEIIPNDILKLRKLRTLDLSCNKIKVLQASIFKLPKLRILNLHGNEISRLPKQLAESHIETLILSRNKFTFIDEELTAKIKKLDVVDNPIENSKSLNEEKQVVVKMQDVQIQNINQNKMEKTNKNKIFISYSHANDSYFNRLMTHLKGLKILKDGFDVWSDKEIHAGQQWKSEISKALSESNIAILLVSPDFLASDFIENNELPPILQKAAVDNTTILCLLVEPCLFSDSKLAEFQAINKPERTLSDMPTPAEQDRTYLALMNEIKRIVNK